MFPKGFSLSSQKPQ